MRRQSLSLRVSLLAAFAVEACTTPRAEAPRYLLPYPVGASFLLLQGNNGPWGHEGKAAFAFDFKMPIGSKVTAARDGVVVKVEGPISFANSTENPLTADKTYEALPVRRRPKAVLSTELTATPTSRDSPPRRSRGARLGPPPEPGATKPRYFLPRVDFDLDDCAACWAPVKSPSTILMHLSGM